MLLMTLYIGGHRSSESTNKYLPVTLLDLDICERCELVHVATSTNDFPAVMRAGTMFQASENTALLDGLFLFLEHLFSVRVECCRKDVCSLG
jgi:hypothetical protein